MRGYDIAIVRLLSFALFIQMGICSLMVKCGNNPLDFYNLHSNSAIYATALFFISLANHHYHCVWNRAMYVFLILIPILNYLDGVFIFFEEAEAYLWFVVIFTILTALITAYLAIRHFVQISKRRMARGN